MLFFIARYTSSHVATTTTHVSDFFVHTMLHNNISTPISEVLKNSIPFFNSPQTQILRNFLRYVSKSSLPILTTSKTASIKLLASFKTRWLTWRITLLRSTATQKPDIYDASIRYKKNALVWVRKEAIHKAHISNFINYKATERETGKLVVSVIKAMWVRKLKWDNTYYTIVNEG